MSEAEFKVRQSPDSIPGRRLVRMGVVAALVGAACVYVSSAVKSCETKSQRAGTESYPAPQPPGTVEDTLVETTRRGLDLADTQRRVLEGYGWVDRAHGVARIPIERAIELRVAGASSPGLSRDTPKPPGQEHAP
jgi:hypothetical protein